MSQMMDNEKLEYAFKLSLTISSSTDYSVISIFNPSSGFTAKIIKGFSGNMATFSANNNDELKYIIGVLEELNNGERAVFAL